MSLSTDAGIWTTEVLKENTSEYLCLSVQY